MAFLPGGTPGASRQLRTLRRFLTDADAARQSHCRNRPGFQTHGLPLANAEIGRDFEACGVELAGPWFV